MMIDALSAVLIGIISAGHCLGMCGGLTVAFGVNSKGASVLAAYNLGRGRLKQLMKLIVLVVPSS